MSARRRDTHSVEIAGDRSRAATVGGMSRSRTATRLGTVRYLQEKLGRSIELSVRRVFRLRLLGAHTSAGATMAAAAGWRLAHHQFAAAMTAVMLMRAASTQSICVNNASETPMPSTAQTGPSGMRKDSSAGRIRRKRISEAQTAA